METILQNPKIIINFIVIIAFTFLLEYLVRKYFKLKIVDRAIEHNIDATSFIFLSHIISTIIYLVGIGWALLVLPITHTFAHSLLAGAGASTLILGFASQQLFTNLISGVFLVLTRPFKIGDVIEFKGVVGTVNEINLNSTILNDENGKKIIIPNSSILNDIIKIQP